LLKNFLHLLIDLCITCKEALETFENKNVLNIFKHLGIDVAKSLSSVKPNLLVSFIGWKVVFPNIRALEK
jgi:hypothetical protein